MKLNKQTHGQGIDPAFPRLLGERLCLDFANTVESGNGLEHGGYLNPIFRAKANPALGLTPPPRRADGLLSGDIHKHRKEFHPDGIFYPSRNLSPVRPTKGLRHVKKARAIPR